MSPQWTWSPSSRASAAAWTSCKPLDAPCAKQFATWIAVQRTRRKQNKLSQDRIARLDSVEFVWAPHTLAWDEVSERLSAYKQTYGHTNVPATWIEDGELGAWVSMQRRLHKK